MFKNYKSSYHNIINILCYSVVFILSYIYFFIEIPLNSDTAGAYTVGSLANLDYKWSFANGRWTKGILELLIEKLGYYNLVPFFMFILLFIVCLYFIVSLNKVFNFNNHILNIFISSVFFITPAFISLLEFFNDLYAHVFAIFIGTILLKRCICKTNFVLYTILLTLMIGVYQSYVCLISAIYVIYFIYKLLFDKNFGKNYKEYEILFFKFLLCSIISVILYFIINKFVIYIFNINSVLDSRFGYDFSINYLIKSILKMYGMVLVLPFVNYAGLNTTLLIKLILFICYIIIIISLILFIKNHSLKLNLTLFALLLILPISMNFIVLASSHTIIQMTFELGLIYILISVFIDYFITNFKLLKIEYRTLINILLILIIFHMVYFANGYSYFSKIVSDSTKSFVVELVSNIKNVENYDGNYRVYFAGSINENNLKDYYSYYDNDTFPLAMPYNSMLFPWEYREVINRYASFNYELPDDDKIDEIKLSDDFIKMNLYPNSNSIKVINDVIVIKFSE